LEIFTPEIYRGGYRWGGSVSHLVAIEFPELNIVVQDLQRAIEDAKKVVLPSTSS
jgi:hypothetical protein